MYITYIRTVWLVQGEVIKTRHELQNSEGGLSKSKGSIYFTLTSAFAGSREYLDPRQTTWFQVNVRLKLKLAER